MKKNGILLKNSLFSFFQITFSALTFASIFYLVFVFKDFSESQALLVKHFVIISAFLCLLYLVTYLGKNQLFFFATVFYLIQLVFLVLFFLFGVIESVTAPSQVFCLYSPFFQALIALLALVHLRLGMKILLKIT